MSTLFISYSRNDKDTVRLIAEKLQQSGHVVLIDEDDIDSGNKWRETLVNHIQSADVFLLLLSSNSITSSEVRRELDVAVDAKKAIIPIELDLVEIPDAFKYQLAGLMRHDLVTDFDAGIERLLDLPTLNTSEQLPGVEVNQIKRISGSTVARCLILLSLLIAAAIVYSIPTGAESEVDSNTSPISVYLMLCATIYALFSVVETLLKKDVLREVSSWMLNADGDSNSNTWPVTFVTLFDSLFGTRKSKRGIQIPSFLRSALVSILAAFLLLAIITYSGIELLVFELEIFPDSWADDGTWGAVIEALVFTLLIAAIFNVVPDFISIIETRFVLQALQKSKSNLNNAMLLFVDVIFTLIIAFIGSIIANFLFPLVAFILEGFDFDVILDWDIPYDIGGIIDVYISILLMETSISDVDTTFFCGVFIYSTFLTSIWIWLYVFSGVVSRILVKFSAFRSLISGTFRVTEKPLSILGGICISLVTVVFWGAQAVAV